MRTSRPRKPKRQKAAQILNGEAEESEEEVEQVKKESARPTPATDIRLNIKKWIEELWYCYAFDYLEGLS